MVPKTFRGKLKYVIHIGTLQYITYICLILYLCLICYMYICVVKLQVNKLYIYIGYSAISFILVIGVLSIVATLLTARETLSGCTLVHLRPHWFLILFQVLCYMFGIGFQKKIRYLGKQCGLQPNTSVRE